MASNGRYGYWVDPQGIDYPVQCYQCHGATARRLLMELGVPKEEAIALADDGLLQRGWARILTDIEYSVDSDQPITMAQARKVEQIFWTEKPTAIYVSVPSYKGWLRGDDCLKVGDCVLGKLTGSGMGMARNIPGLV